MKITIFYQNGHIYRFSNVISYHIFNRNKTVVLELKNGQVRVQSIDFVNYIQVSFTNN